jgi:NADPH:quinone reductase-like Zn-dependent oxidoreductase
MALQANTGLQLRSIVKKSGELELSLVDEPVREPGPGEIVVRVEATPINPSDLGLLTGPADLKTAKASGTKQRPVVTATVPQNLLRVVAARLDQSMPVGNEGAGTVVSAGTAPEARALIGKKVAMLGGAMYAQYRTINAADVLVLPDDASAADGASCFVNPLTALAMVETMRMEGHTALLHTAAASNLGQMLQKICIADGIQLVNVVRSDEQAALLKKIGAKHVVNSKDDNFMESLVEALAQTGATIGFDAIGGGKLAGQILTAMEQAALRKTAGYNRYGSNTFKQVYIYGALDTGPTELTRAFGFSWSLSGFLLTPFIQKIGPAATQKLRDRVRDELKTTFASHYTRTISLAEALDLDTLLVYSRRATGEKFLIDPNRGL